MRGKRFYNPLVISRKVLASIILGIAGVLIMTWRIARIPSHVVVINQTGVTLQRVSIETSGGRIDLGAMNNEEARRISVDPTEMVRLRFHGNGNQTWRSPEPLTAGQSLVLYVTPEDHVEARNRIAS